MPKKKPVPTTTTTSKKNVTDDTTKDDYYSPQAKFSQKMSEISIREKEVKAAEDAQRLGLQYIDLLLFPVTPEALKMLPEEEARKNKVVCFFNEDKQVRLGALEMNDQVSQIVSLLEEDGENKVEVYIISEHSLERVFKLYANLPIIKPVNKEINITDEELEKFGVGISSLSSLQEKFKNVSTTDVLSLLVVCAQLYNTPIDRFNSSKTIFSIS
jgi:uncharacterized protein YeeX (DUF496 family)